jgi:hypothetical protein
MVAACVQPQPVTSCLAGDKNGMDRIMLEVIVSSLVTRPEHIRPFLTCTLLSAEHVVDNKATADWQDRVVGAFKASIGSLQHQGFVQWRPDKGGGGGAGAYEARPLARATIAAGLTTRDALVLHEDVTDFVAAANLEADLHFMYLIAPVQKDTYIEWGTINRVLNDSGREKRKSVQKVVELAGINLNLARRKAQFQCKSFTPKVRTGNVATLRALAVHSSSCAAAACTRFMHVFSALQMLVGFVVQTFSWCLAATAPPPSPRSLGPCRAHAQAHAAASSATAAVQEPEYNDGKRVGPPDAERKLYKLFLAFVLEALVDEVPVETVIKTFYNPKGDRAQALVKPVQELQVRRRTRPRCTLLCRRT